LGNWAATKGKESIESTDVKENLYNAAGATRLANANKVTRSLSTKMGHLWEVVSQLSPYAINPEAEFGNLKIKGVDIIALNYNTSELEYIQLKTKKDTLTAGQKSRVVNELKIHDNPVFCAAFDLGPWHFISKEVPRSSGEGYWRRIGMDYEMVKKYTYEMIGDLEEKYFKTE
jgi:hypothetical protein